jgi:hypothetical protein
VEAVVWPISEAAAVLLNRSLRLSVVSRRFHLFPDACSSFVRDAARR